MSFASSVSNRTAILLSSALVGVVFAATLTLPHVVGQLDAANSSAASSEVLDGPAVAGTALPTQPVVLADEAAALVAQASSFEVLPDIETQIDTVSGTVTVTHQRALLTLPTTPFPFPDTGAALLTTVDISNSTSEYELSYFYVSDGLVVVTDGGTQ